MHGPINVKSPNNISEWQMGFNSAFKGLMVSNFALCGMPFLALFYSRDFILEMYSMRYVNMFGFFLIFVSTGLALQRNLLLLSSRYVQ